MKLLFTLGLCCLLLLSAAGVAARETIFEEFSADLPEGWEGDEKRGFSSGDRDEYMLVMSIRDSEKTRHLAQVSIYILPNRQGTEAREFAARMAERQGDATTPAEEGPFWVFTGDPRNNAVKGLATTRVSATRQWLLVIIAQDPKLLGAAYIVKSLRGISPRAGELLARPPQK